jgi:hypothetical protein
MVARRAELERQGRAARLDDGELQRRQQQHPAADVGTRQPDVPLRCAGPLAKGHGRPLWYYILINLVAKELKSSTPVLTLILELSILLHICVKP